MNTSLNEYEKGGKIEFMLNTVGSHHGQTDMVLMAKEDSGKYVGYVEFSEFEGIPAVSYIATFDGELRKGVATALAKELQRMYPKEEIDWGSTTLNGADFLKSLPMYKVENREFKILAKRLKMIDIVLAKMDKVFSSLDSISPKDMDRLRPSFNQLSDKFNELHDKKLEITRLLNKMKASKVFIRI